MRADAGQYGGHLQERRGRSQEAGRNAAQRPQVRGAAPGELMASLNDGARLQERLGYSFANPLLLERALTHSSALPELRAAAAEDPAKAEAAQDNERLEFLGDAVLELLASEYL